MCHSLLLLVDNDVMMIQFPEIESRLKIQLRVFHRNGRELDLAQRAQVCFDIRGVKTARVMMMPMASFSVIINVRFDIPKNRKVEVTNGYFLLDGSKFGRV